jgi:dTDP-4-dehydrorhamnose reductase
VTRLLITGAGGLLGGRLVEQLGSHFEVIAARHRSATPPGVPAVELELASPEAIARALREARPDAIVHCAALADADACQREPDRAQVLNVAACEALARLCRSGGVRLVAVSTDFVLDGTRSFADEDAPTRPLMTYGRTKLLGEEAVLTLAPGSAVVRVALVHGRGHGPRPSASESTAWALRAGRRLRLFTDQFRTPVDPESVASAVEALLSGTAAGRFHLGGPERLSRHELGLRTARLLGLREDLIEAAVQADLPLAAPRPAEASLDSSRARRELGYRPRPLDAGLREGRLGSEGAAPLS